MYTTSKKTSDTPRCSSRPGLVPGEFPFGLALAVGAMAIAVPEMSKTPESPPGFYGFDPLNLKDAQRVTMEGFMLHIWAN